MKILFLVSSLNAGGAERVACTLANAWVAKGYEVTLVPCFTHGSGKSFYPLDKQVNVEWLSQSLPSNKWLARLIKPFILRRLIKQSQADVVVSFLTNVNVMALLAKLGLRIPVIVSERSNPHFQKIDSSLKFLRKKLYPTAEAVILQTEAAATQFQKDVPGCRRLVVIPNPLPQTLPKELPNRQAGSVVVAMGRLVESKQFERLIRIFAKLHPHYPDWHLHIYGEGPEEDHLNHLIVEQGLQKVIHLKGNTSTPWEVMRQASILAITSRLEGFPNVMLEGMANGLPTIAYDCPSGPKELSLDGQVAKLIPLNDDTAFAQTLGALMQNVDERQRLAMAGQESVFQRYSQAQVLQLWDTLFHEAQSS